MLLYGRLVSKDGMFIEFWLCYNSAILQATELSLLIARYKTYLSLEYNQEENVI